ncbi:hypothetical protein Cva_00376 [Caedimonas varicaedens]|jgi:hypothetical protein|uniref:DUF721 domain-containing protein n=1 Tax=Caedimonas varicaedens TaxID=1629334 RepID=A0A0K8MB99_9PROT|nr:hypothetical protein Cva_00376 [Caedimonas varicaedens]
MSRPQQVFSGPRPLAKMMTYILKPALRSRSAHEATLMLDWIKIIKPDLAQRCYPERLIFARGQKEEGTLVIAADSGSSLLIQHSEPLLIDCINAYFGYKIVGKIKIRHTRISFGKKEKSFVKEMPVKENPDDPLFDSINDPELKAALGRLKAVYYSKISKTG